MEMPSYDTYANWFGGGPMAVHFGMNQMDLAKQFQRQNLEQEVQDTRTRELANLFSEKMDPLKVDNQRTSNELLGYQTSDAGVKSRINSATEGLQLDAAQRKLILDAKQADIDAFELGAQQMAYSPDPNVRTQGEALLKAHRDFLKLREQERMNTEQANQRHRQALELENVRHHNQTARQDALARARAEATTATRNMSTDQRRAWHQQQGFEAQQRGDFDAANMHYDQVRYLTEIRAFERPDPMAGRPDFSAQGVPVVPQREAPVPPVPQDTRGPISRTLPQPAAPAQLPQGSRQVGTSRGKPVFETPDGQRFILE